MSKELSRFVINNACEKFGLLLDFEQCSICGNKCFDMDGFMVIECEKFPILLTLFHNHITQQNALKPLYKIYILGFYFCFKPYLYT
jgi:hypothetical protein